MQAPSGLARRARRLSESETARRLLDTAVDSLTRTGLTVGLDHISLEELIREAGVSRSAVYRRWPYKDLFFADLVKELAKNAVPTIVDEEIAALKDVVAQHQDWLDTTEHRAALVAELIRQLALVDFEVLYRSARWRTYLALQATFMSIADDATRQQVQAALAESEQEHTAAVAQAWEMLVGLLGYRLRPETAATFETLATLLTAAMRGLVIMALSDPAIATRRTTAAPFGAGHTAQWSLPATALASLASGLLEPDPTIDWDAERVQAVCAALGRLGPLDT